MHPASSPFAIANVRLFLAFRVLFNSRFYYPVFTILFLDFGLTIEQFSLLNTVWAITIVLAEVPSGALADILGRKYLLVATSLCMVVEMSLLAFVPLGNSSLIFSVFLINRILSGLAEAMASGADEAIAYDSLVKEGDASKWPQVLSVQLRMRSVGSIVTMTIGALVYDPKVVNRVLDWFGVNQTLPQEVTMRFPIYLTLLLAVLATFAALKMREDKPQQDKEMKVDMAEAMRVTLLAGRWIAQTPFAFAVIIFGMTFDHVLRMIVTMTSQYFRLIQLPEASFGIIGSAMGLLGLVTPKIAEKMAEKNSPTVNMLWIAAISMAGLISLAGFFPYWGLIPVALIFTGLTFVSFFTSHYLNQIASSAQRATVLSFKGLAFNLAYGSIGFFFAILMNHKRGIIAGTNPDAASQLVENNAFMESITWLPWYMIICLGACVAISSMMIKRQQ